MYIIQTVLVMLCVYVAPALAVRPTLASDPRTAIAIPFISVLLVFVLYSALSLFGAYQPIVVQIISAILVIVSVLRIVSTGALRKRNSKWTDYDRNALVIAIALGTYVALRLIESGFDESDETYSWNMWAIQHYLGETIDFYYTQAPYPQLFPKILSFSYKLLGSIEAQTAVKTSLLIFPIGIFFTIGIAVDGRRDSRLLFLQAILGLVLIKGVELDSILDDGMPDTMMTAALASSIFFLVLYQRGEKKLEFLLLSIVTAIAAVLAKQPALVWALFSLPLLLGLGAYTKTNRWNDFYVSLAPAIIALIWMLTEGGNFYDNDGVVSRSFSERDLVSQFVYSLERWFVGKPLILGLTLFGAMVAFKNGVGRNVFILFTIPSLATWFLFANYDIRAGAPALVSIALVIAFGNFGLKPMPAEQTRMSLPNTTALRLGLMGGLFLVSILGGVYELVKYKKQHQTFQIGITEQSNLFRLFGDEADVVYAQIRSQDVKLWTASNYVYGLFYGYIDVIRPEYDGARYNLKTLMKQIRNEQPDFLINSGNVPFGPGGMVLDELVTQSCPRLFDKIAGPENKHRISAYKLNKQLLETGYCGL